MMRNFSSRYGMSSVRSASPYGPLFVRGVHTVGIVEIGCWVLESDRKQSGEGTPAPGLVEVVTRVRLAARGLPHVLEQIILLWRLGRETEGGVQAEVILLVHDRVIDIRIIVVTLREQHRRADFDRMPPELGKQLALKFDSPHPLRVLRLRQRRDRIVELERDGLALGGIEMNALRSADKITRRERPALTLPLIHGSPDDVTIRSSKLGVHMEDGLDVVVTRRELPQAP